MAFTVPIDSAVTGEIAPAALWNTFVRDNLMSTMHVLARKSADQTVNNSTTLVDDTHLLFSVAANEVWLIHAYLLIDSASTVADIKFHWTVPASATMVWGPTGGAEPSFTQWDAVLTSTSADVLGTESGTQNFGTNSVPTQGLLFAGVAAIAGTAGTVRLQWAQVTATVANTTLKTNSTLIGARLT
jgi:hypothetical protein